MPYGESVASPLLRLPTADNNAERIERFLLDAVRVDGDPYLTDITSHLIKAGGKRQRPHLTATAAAVGLADGEPVADDVIRGGVAVELVQVGSLYHDDVMDEADIRRQVDSVNARWGNHRAILAGDYLLAQAAVIAASLGVEVAGLLGSTIAELCKGQVAELQSLNDLDRTAEAYFPSIAGKTASLFAASTRIGGIVAGFDAATVDQLTDYGHLYGMAFQVVDDILDVIATDEELGKPAGNDMLEGVYSLPVIHTLSGPTGDELRTLLAGGLTLDDRHQAIACVRNGPGIDAAYEVAADYVSRARSAILGLSNNQAATAMADIAQHLLQSVTALREGS